MGDNLTIRIVSSSSESLHVQLDLASATVLSLKQLIAQQDGHRFPVASQRLIFQGQILQDANLLTEYHVTRGCAVHLTLLPVTNDAPASSFAPSAQLQRLLEHMRDHEPRELYATAVQTLQKICSNIVTHPTDDKYRKLRTENPTLKTKLLDRSGGHECVQLLGFQDGVETVRESDGGRDMEQTMTDAILCRVCVVG